MKQNILISLTCMGIVVSSSCKQESKSQENNIHVNTEVIHINVDEVVEELDISSYLEDKIDIIVLETREDCFLSEIKKIIPYNNYFFISDQTASGIFIFNDEGKFIQKIAQKGNGPEEIAMMGDFIINKNQLIIQDIASFRYLIYDLEKSNYLKSISYTDHHHNIFALDNNYYLTSLYYGTQKGDYNLIQYNSTDHSLTYHLPYDKKLTGKISYAPTYHVGKINKSALVIYPFDSYIYEITLNSISAKYKTDFSSRSFINNMDQVATELSLEEIIKNEFIYGFSYIQQSEAIIIATYYDLKRKTYLLFDKNSTQTKLAHNMILKDVGNIPLLSNFIIEKEEIIWHLPAFVLLTNWDVLHKDAFYREIKNKEKIEKVWQGLKEDDNPILLKMKFRKPTK